MTGKDAHAVRTALSPFGRAGTGEMFVTMLLAFAAVCAVELLAAATSWSRMLDVAVAWWLFSTAVRRANDIGRTWRLPATILVLATAGLGTAAYALIMGAFGADVVGYLLFAAVPLIISLVLGGMLIFAPARAHPSRKHDREEGTT
jgi:peptidoglycan biosynthesis protein MviN/MurJ (putative lipid II flippase)